MTPASVSPAEQAARLQEREAKQAAIIDARHQLALAYAEVFGFDGSRTERQKAVVKNLREVCSMDATTAMQRPDGNVDPQMTLILEGRRQICIHLTNLIADAASPPK